MGKLFRREHEYSDEEYENEELETEDFEDDEEIFEADDDEIEDDDSDEDEYSDEDDDSDEDNDSYEDDDDDEDFEEDDEMDRRTYRRRRRIRNQIISYSVVAVFLAAIVTCGVFAGRSVVHIAKEKRLAKQQEEMEAQVQAQLEAEAAHDVVIAAPEPIVEEPESDPLGEVVESSISAMPLEDKVAGLFIVTPEELTGVNTATKAGDGTQEALNKWGIGGLIYFDKNITDREQITEMLASTVSKSKYPIFMAVDEEGGSVSRVAKSIDVVQVGDMAAIGEAGDTAQAYEVGLTIGTYLKEIGFNLDFAPVADVSGSGKSAMGDRVFGSDAQMVGDMVANVVEGIEGTGVSSCLKHFPGIGAAEEDTHDGRVETEKTLDEMRESDFIPFKAGIEAGADFVMVSHITVAAVEDEAVPSSLSKTIMTDVLRNELEFQGIIITDALNMSAITEYYTTEEAAVMAIQGGADMLLMPEDFEKAYEAVLAAVQDGQISEERINESLRRIYRVKYRDRIE